MRKVFIDCGFYHGKGMRLFKTKGEYEPDFELIAFEPMVDVEAAERKHKGVKFYNKAVWIEDGIINFHSSNRRGGQANGIFENPRAKSERVTPVESVDFGNWIKKNFDKTDYIVVKMDIEGAEQDVLEKMVEDKSIEYLNILYVEFHTKQKPGYTALKTALKELESLDLRGAIEWYFRRRRK